MCIVIWWGDYDSEVATQADLAARLGGADALIRGYGESYDPEVCLCPIEVAETLTAAGLTFKRDDWGDWLVTTTAPPETASVDPKERGQPNQETP